MIPGDIIPDVQFLANRGFAVLQVNYRGSSGYGKAFLDAGFKELGGKIQQDITDGVNWLIASKTANPKKIAIYGRGFGGYSALYGVSFNPRLYNCAIIQDGLIDLFSYINTIPAFFKSSLQKKYLQRMTEMVGDPGKDYAHLRDISPAFHPDKIKVPVIIFQAEQDPRANIPELDIYYHELLKRNAQVPYVKYKGVRSSGASDSTKIRYGH